jgi:hypothetical protein
MAFVAEPGLYIRELALNDLPKTPRTPRSSRSCAQPSRSTKYRHSDRGLVSADVLATIDAFLPVDR